MTAFFVSCPVNFEQELILEIENFWFQLMDLDGLPTRGPIPEFKIDVGGLEFKTEMHLGLQINFFSHIALRVLMRIESFEARYFDQFEKSITKLNLEKYFPAQKINIQIESIKSRLFHEGNLLESCTKALSLRKYIYDKEADITLLLRLVKDRVMVSLDTSGEHLHFRGYRKHQGEAPIRENLASLILQMADWKSSANYTVLDPYCGAGTILFEEQLKAFPNFSRDYAFFKFKSTPAIFKSDSWKKNFRWIKFRQNIHFIGVEKNPETIKKLNLNTEEFKTHFAPISLNVCCDDSEKMDINQLNDLCKNQPVRLITNPPYGERSAGSHVVQNIERLENLKNLEQIVVIHPENWKFQFKKLKLKKAIPFSNQGLKTKVSIFEKSQDTQNQR